MTISIACEKCGFRYKLKDELAGKKVKCKECQAVFVVPQPAAPPTPVATTGHGDPVYRYSDDERPTQFEMAIGDSENIELISEHIEFHCGPVSGVIHELLSDLVHIDIHRVEPSQERPYHTLVTSGMSDRPMNAPEQVAECQYAELMLCLPPNWPLDEKSLEDGRNYWPLYLLKMLARFPHKFSSWLWWGHTMPNGDPAEPYADNTQHCCALLMSPLLFGKEFRELKVDDEKTIHFFSIVPLYKEEMELKLEKGTESLFDGFDKHNVNELLDVKRVNVCKKKGWW
jgi:Suppressor of fused protein (SUFU)